MNPPSLLRGDLLADRIIDRHPLTANPETSVREAILLMEQADTDCIFAIETDPTGFSRFLGWFSTREVVRLVACDLDLDHSVLREVIFPGAIAIPESEVQNLSSILALYRQHCLHYLPVVGDRGELVGAIAADSLFEAIAEMNLEELERQQGEQQLLEKRLQTSEARLRVLIESIRDIVLVVEAEGTQLEVVPTHPALVYDPETDLVGQTIEQFFQEAVADRFVLPVREALAAQKTVHFEYCLSVGNAEVWYDAGISPLSERSALWIARDITQRKRAEVEVLKALERERELNELKSRFISMTSHEFRTPLTVIQSSAQLLQRYDWSRSEQLQHLQQIQLEVQHMTALMEDILILGKAEAGKLEFNPEPLELIDFCRSLVSQMQLAPGAQHSLVFSCAIAANELQVCMDKKLLRQILNNLLSNAIAYSPTGSVIRLSLSLSPDARESDRVVFEVKDSGIGIPPEAQSRLFESFYRASNTGNIAGTGLGLTIVKQCVDLHRGAIAWESQLGAGTTFRAILPLRS